ncbi:hypothetical protein [Streptomyces olivochromogenes]|uniref:hypothetical protein n=1 Tax=Streptomyces olivochromogenes TaxID=1963 RepID=UPI000746B9BF|nr:hypothetical protein [Streptomyces olivochromogenes]KUN49861.1 hypothetical protein AQJ27_00475 [Streptomyces olivochromogenes]
MTRTASSRPALGGVLPQMPPSARRTVLADADRDFRPRAISSTWMMATVLHALRLTWTGLCPGDT